MSQKLQTLLSLIQSDSDIPEDIRFFLLDQYRIIRCIRGDKSIQAHPQEFAFINQLTLQRGSILETFARLEGFVNEFFHLKFFGLSYTYSDDFDALLEFVTFESRVRLLRRWNIINRNTTEKMTAVTGVRNYLAHAWEPKTATYKRHLLVEPEVFARFQTDLRKIFEHLIQQYHTEQQKYDFDSYLQGLVDRIQKFNSLRHHQEVDGEF